MSAPRQALDRRQFAALSPDDRIDEICDCFVAEWQTGERPDFAAFLELCEPTERPLLFTELLLLDRELRSTSGPDRSWEEYETIYPAFTEQIEEVRFRELDAAKSQSSAASIQNGQQRVDHFKLLERIGVGASGTVWKAYDERLKRAVALKISNGTAYSERQLGRFLREAQTVSTLRHPGIVSVYAVNRIQHGAYIVSDFVAGSDLRKSLRASRPSHHQAAEWCRQIAEALHYAHGKGVIHRDIKPANVLIDEHEEAVLTDFGLAKTSSRSSLSLANHILGTPAYMSPEQAKGKGREADARSDVYSLGIILYEMLSGQVPFDGDFESVLHQVLTQSPERLRRIDSSIPPDLELICDRCIEKQPVHRYSSAQLVADDLKRYLNGERISAHRYRTATFTLRRFRRGLTWSLVILGALVAITLAKKFFSVTPPSTAVPALVTVRIDSVPSNAKIAFVPLGSDGEPIVEKAYRPAQTTPLELGLTPADYLIEAELPSGQFQEVYRRVSKADQRFGFSQDHFRWTTTKDGKVVLPNIRIPNKDDHERMVLVSVGGDEDEKLPPFYVDESPVTGADYLRLIGTLPGYLPKELPRDQPISLIYHDAVQYAERAGKRLPTLEEWRRAQSVLPARSPADLAEWTATWHRSPTADEPEGYIETNQIVCGNGGAASDQTKPFDPVIAAKQWFIASRNQQNPKIGLRCVRDAAPRFLSAEVSQPTSDSK